jgi:hypothetical protein
VHAAFVELRDRVGAALFAAGRGQASDGARQKETRCEATPGGLCWGAGRGRHGNFQSLRLEQGLQAVRAMLPAPRHFAQSIRKKCS